jgi:hypothetical protein
VHPQRDWDIKGGAGSSRKRTLAEPGSRTVGPKGTHFLHGHNNLVRKEARVFDPNEQIQNKQQEANYRCQNLQTCCVGPSRSAIGMLEMDMVSRAENAVRSHPGVCRRRTEPLCHRHVGNECGLTGRERRTRSVVRLTPLWSAV